MAAHANAGCLGNTTGHTAHIPKPAPNGPLELSHPNTLSTIPPRDLCWQEGSPHRHPAPTALDLTFHTTCQCLLTQWVGTALGATKYTGPGLPDVASSPDWEHLLRPPPSPVRDALARCGSVLLIIFQSTPRMSHGEGWTQAHISRHWAVFTRHSEPANGGGGGRSHDMVAFSKIARVTAIQNDPFP